jgi:hypothetical protein
MFPKLAFPATDLSLRPGRLGWKADDILQGTPAGARVARMELKLVGPGRKERAYLGRVAELEREIETISLVERGSARRLDRMEKKLAATREAALALEQQEKRLILALGALQRENEILREKLALQLQAPKRRGFVARLLGRP